MGVFRIARIFTYDHNDYWMQPISAVYSDGRVVVPTQNEAESLYQEGYGSRLESRLLILEPFEALYHVERGKVAVIDEASQEKLTFRELLSRFSKTDRDIWTRYIVYRDLRTRGFVARKSEGEGVEFSVYKRGMFRKQPPSYNVYTISEGSPETFEHMEEVLEKTEEQGRSLRLTVVDRRGEVVYYTLSEMGFTRDEG